MATINNKFQQRKPSVRPVSSKAVPPTSKADKAVAPSTPATPTKTGAPAAVRTEDQLREEEVEQKLRAFDLDMRFGPCLGITRLQRWERAHANGLNPPAEIKELLEATTNPAQKENLWRDYKDTL